MGDIKINFIFVVLLLSFMSCNSSIYQLDPDHGSSYIVTEYYCNSIPYIKSDYFSSNLNVNTSGLSEDYLLVADGDVVGFLSYGLSTYLKIELDSDKLVELWLIKREDITSEEDIVVSNCSFIWTTKLYINTKIIEWNPKLNNIESVGSVIFSPDNVMYFDWDYVVGYLNNDESEEPIAVLTPWDSISTIVELPFGRNIISWTYYISRESGNLSPQIVGQVEQEIILIEDENYRVVLLGDIEKEQDIKMSILFENNEDYTVQLVLNGSQIENFLSSGNKGSSYVEGNGFRSYNNLLVQDMNILTINNDSGEIVFFEFNREDYGQLFLRYFNGEIIESDSIYIIEEPTSDYLDDYYSNNLFL